MCSVYLYKAAFQKPEPGGAFHMECHARWHSLHSGLTLRWVILGQIFGWASEERTKREGGSLRCNRWHVTGTWGKQQRSRTSDTNCFKELTLRWCFLSVFRRGLASYSAEQSNESQDFQIHSPLFSLSPSLLIPSFLPLPSPSSPTSCCPMTPVLNLEPLAWEARGVHMSHNPSFLDNFRGRGL